MFYDPKTNAVDAVNMCSAAQSCMGSKRASLLKTAIEDMKTAFDPHTGLVLSDQEHMFYSIYMVTAERMLRAMERAPVKSEQLTSLHDATVMFNAALECKGTNRNNLLGKARWDLSRAEM